MKKHLGKRFLQWGDINILGRGKIEQELTAVIRIHPHHSARVQRYPGWQS
jgi:hypothetical protein